MQRKSLASLVKIGLVVATFGLIVQVQAADPSGTWSWTTPGRNGGPDRKSTLKLKAEGEKLTGKLSTPGRQGNTTDTDIEEGKVKGDEVSFKVSREFNGMKFVSKYHGKLSGDSIKGKVEVDRNGETQERDWEAKREVEKK
jgi:hypothetical protein